MAVKFFCGVFGKAYAAPGVDVRPTDANRFANWKNCQHLEMEKSTSGDKAVLYPKCAKGHVVDKGHGASICRLLRGSPVQCPDYNELPTVVKPPLVTRDELKELGFDFEEIQTICGDSLISTSN